MIRVYVNATAMLGRWVEWFWILVISRTIGITEVSRCILARANMAAERSKSTSHTSFLLMLFGMHLDPSFICVDM